MIDLYYWTTPNGHKITIFLEETGLPYRIVPVNISKGEQFRPEFLAISPNNRMPAIVDHSPKDGGDPLSVFESGAILVYLADKTGRYLPNGLRDRIVVMEWLFWQMAGLGPMAGQNHHFSQYAPEKIPYAIERYMKETNRPMACSTNVLRIANSSPTAIRSLIWPSIPGWCLTSGKAKSLRTSHISSAGLKRYEIAPPSNGLMPRLKKSIPRRRSARNRKRFFSVKLQR